MELKERRSRGESGLIIRNGAVVTRPPRHDNQWRRKQKKVGGAQV